MSGLEVPTDNFIEFFCDRTGASHAEALLYLIFYSTEGLTDRDRAIEAIDAYKADHHG